MLTTLLLAQTATTPNFAVSTPWNAVLFALSIPVLALVGLALLALLAKRGVVPLWIVHALAGGKGRAAPTNVYTRRSELLSRGELAFYHALLAAAEPTYRVMAKVRVADLISPRGNDRAAFAALQRISRKHADFVVCDRATLEPLAVVELDDRSHDAPRRRERDALIDDAYAAAGLPIVHFRASSRYDPRSLSEQIQSALPPRRDARRA